MAEPRPDDVAGLPGWWDGIAERQRDVVGDYGAGVHEGLRAAARDLRSVLVAERARPDALRRALDGLPVIFVKGEAYVNRTDLIAALAGKEKE